MTHLDTLLTRYPALEYLRKSIELAFSIMKTSYLNDGKTLLCGNGGSAADCEHIVGELMKDFCVKRTISAEFAQMLDDEVLAEGLRGALPAISLCSQTALMTALMNDGDPSLVFAQQVYGYGREGDVLIALSTSGNSLNIVRAAKVAKARGMKVIAITGWGGGKLSEIADCTLRLPETETFKVQEYTLPIYHALCLMLEEYFFVELKGQYIDNVFVHNSYPLFH